MIFVFGAILQSIRVTTDSENAFGPVNYTKHYKNSVGGKGALQALAAAKAGARTALAGRTGDDELAKHILLRLRTHGVMTSGVAKAEKMQTGTAITITDENRTILALGAGTKSSAGQIPVEALDANSIVLLQTELNAGENSVLLDNAHKAGATTIVNISPQASLNDGDWANIDYLIAPAARKDYVTKSKGEAALTALYMHEDASVERIGKDGQSAKFAKPPLEAFNWQHPEGSEDSFCGTFAAALDMGLPMRKAIERAHIAAALTASVPGAYDAIPYPDQVEECLKAAKAQNAHS